MSKNTTTFVEIRPINNETINFADMEKIGVNLTGIDTERVHFSFLKSFDTKEEAIQWLTDHKDSGLSQSYECRMCKESQVYESACSGGIPFTKKQYKEVYTLA